MKDLEKESARLSTTLAAAIAGYPDLAQATPQRHSRLRVGRDIVHEAEPFGISHDGLCPPKELGQFHDGLQSGHERIFICQ